jgi:ribosomal protein S18 acetylase RimI-like enzyme
MDNPKYGLWVAVDSQHHPEHHQAIMKDFEIPQGGYIVGYMLCGPCGLPHPEASESNGELKKLYLHKSTFGTGVGARLFELGEQWLMNESESGLKRPIYIGVWSENWRAHSFYMRKHGYVKVGEYQYRVGRCVDREFILREPTPEDGDDVKVPIESFLPPGMMLETVRLILLKLFS